MATKFLTHSYVHHASNSHFENIAVGRLLDDVTKQFPNKEAVVFLKDNTRKTFTELHRDVNQLAAGLVQLGMKPRDRVGIWADESYDWIKTDLAVTTAGMISARLPSSSSPQRLFQLLEKLECTALIIGVTHTDQLKALHEILPSMDIGTETKLPAKELPWLQHIISMSPIQQSWISKLEDIIKLGDQIEAKEELEKMKMLPSLDDVQTIMFTSGSTGVPKAVAIPNKRLLDTRNAFNYFLEVTKETIKTKGLVMPLVNSFSSGAYTVAEALMLCLGSTIVLPFPAQDTDAMLVAIEKEKCNTAPLYPMQVEDINHHAEIHQFDLSSLTHVMAVGNVFSPSALKKLSSIIDTDVQQIYGSNEAGYMTGHSANRSLDEKICDVGFPTFHGEIKICDESTGQIVHVGKIGEVFFRGMTMFSCYWGDEEKTKAAKRANGWYYTSDLGKMDERGNLTSTVIGRKDNVIIKGAQNIYPSEIEHAVAPHPKIKLHNVVAVPDARFVNELCLCLVLKDGEKATEEEFKEYLKDKIDGYLIPRYVVFMESFPIMTSTGKLNGKELTKMAARALNLSN